MNRTRRTIRGFTLVEIMVVVLILGVLTALVVSVGHYVLMQANEKATKNYQAILLEAITAYYNAYTDPNDEHAYPPDNGDPNTSGQTLLAYLQRVDASKTALRHLPIDALGTGDSAVKDAWGNPMRYDASGGVSGPVIISAGPDGNFDAEMSIDNIRSDGR